MATIEMAESTRAILIDIQRQLMSDWSELWWCAGWMVDTEVRAWEGAAFNGREMSPYDSDVIAIHELSKLTGVWCLMDYTVPLDVWAERHGPALTKMAGKEPTDEQQAALDRSAEAQRQHLDRISTMFTKKT